MHLPSITSAYLAVLALLYTVLAVQVGRLRQRDRAAFGDNGSLHCAARSARMPTSSNTCPSSR